jgi:hypothetical protein
VLLHLGADVNVPAGSISFDDDAVVDGWEMFFFELAIDHGPDNLDHPANISHFVSPIIFGFPPGANRLTQLR